MTTPETSPDENSQNTPRIKVSRNGPYLVSGGVPLAEQHIMNDASNVPRRWREGRQFPRKDSYALCRCGKSGNKPFCDGSHLDV